MTIDHKIVVGLEDIKAITLECLNPEVCRARVSGSPDTIKIPDNCPQCGHQWAPLTVSGFLGPKAWPYAAFVNAVRAIRKQKSPENAPGFKILLEFKSDG